jgi:hypothetical protein
MKQIHATIIVPYDASFAGKQIPHAGDKIKFI